MKKKRTQVMTILAFPIVLTIGIAFIPVVTDYTDHRLAERAVSQVGRWFLGHIISAIGFPLCILAVGEIEKHLRSASGSLPRLTFPFLVIGAGLYSAGLGADGIGPIALQAAGYSPVIFFDGSELWVTGIFIAGTIVFGIGLLLTATGTIREGLLKGRNRYISFVSSLLFMVAPAILSGWALYGVVLASFGIFVPMALAILGSEE